MTPEALATKIATRSGAQAFEAPPQITGERGPGAFVHDRVIIGGEEHGIEKCVTELTRTAMHDDCKIVWGLCPHGILGWRNLRPPKVRANRTLRRRIKRRVR